jgi:DNA-3-methyladenine glycosylase
MVAMWDVLPRAFYDRDPVIVAQALLGKQLVREHADGLVTGIIVETEAYLAAHDPASHAYSRRRHCYRKTSRCAPMFGPPGHAYVYRSYGLHYCLNIVTEAEDTPSAVLLRAVQPEAGLDVMHRRRRTSRRAALATGPGNLCQAFAIDLTLNGWDVTQGQHLWVATPASSAVLQIVRSRRIGVVDDLELRFSVVSRCARSRCRRRRGAL